MKKLHTLIGAAFIFSATAASASDSVELSNAELDGVTAGITLATQTLSLAFADAEGEGGGFTGVFTDTESGASYNGSGEAGGFTFGTSESASDDGSSFAAGSASSGGDFEAAGITDINASSQGGTITETDVASDSASAFAASGNTTLMFIDAGQGGVSSGSESAVFITDVAP